MKNRLKVELRNAYDKLENLQNWLCNNVNHPDFMLIARDRNALTVKVAAIEFKIEQLDKGLPILGEAIRDPEAANSKSQSLNGFKSTSN
jgi:hypothetical protein